MYKCHGGDVGITRSKVILLYDAINVLARLYVFAILSDWWPTPLKNDGVRQWGLWHSQDMESHKSYVSNHQPDISLTIINPY